MSFQTVLYSLDCSFWYAIFYVIKWTIGMTDIVLYSSYEIITFESNDWYDRRSWHSLENFYLY